MIIIIIVIVMIRIYEHRPKKPMQKPLLERSCEVRKEITRKPFIKRYSELARAKAVAHDRLCDP